MKQVNQSVLKEVGQDRDPNWCVFCDAKDRCTSCDAIDFGDGDCDNCDFGKEE